VVARRDEVEQGSSGDTHARDKDGWSMLDGGDRWCTVTTMSPCAVSHVRCDRRKPFKRLLWLSSGLGSISYFQSFSIMQTLQFKLVSFPMSKIGKIL
jgi:hypothetical protein